MARMPASMLNSHATVRQEDLLQEWKSIRQMSLMPRGDVAGSGAKRSGSFLASSGSLEP